MIILLAKFGCNLYGDMMAFGVSGKDSNWSRSCAMIPFFFRGPLFSFHARYW